MQVYTQQVSPILKVGFWIILSGLLIFLTFNRHSKTGTYNYRSQIYADKAGYYVYLPATFIYNFDASKFPEKVDEKTGNGFQLDLLTNKTKTKYFYGVSLMQLPFFLAAHYMAHPLGFKADGFSLIYHWAIDLAAIFYLLSAFLLLYKILRTKYSIRASLTTIFFLFSGTNLFYYAIQETGMSHVYSFFLFTARIYLLSFWRVLSKKTIHYGLLLGLTATLIIFVRPLNLLFLLITLFLNTDFRIRFRSQLRWQILTPFFLGFALIAAPQFIYWKYLSGRSFFTNTYAGESFSNWMNPKIIEFLFSPNNGFVIYTPLILVIIAGIFLMIWKKNENGWLFLSTILILIIVSASWWSWHFGCGYSARNFVEYYSLLSFPLAFLIDQPKAKNYTFLLYFLLFLFTTYNLKMIFSYGGCWFGHGNWDWAQYAHWLSKWPV